MNMLKRAALAAGLLVAAGTCLADAGRLEPRQVVPKTQTALLRVPENATGRMIVKFADAARARAVADGQVASEVATPLDAVNRILQRFRMTATPAINHPPAVLAALEARAAEYSGKEQPDLAGMLYIDGPPGSLLAAARALNDLDVLEYVSFERRNVVGQDPACGEVVQTCFDPSPDQTPFCAEQNCCELIGTVYPLCIDENFGEWDQLCAWYAHLLCSIGEGANRCAAGPTNGSCFEEHTTGGCNNGDCCDIVCALPDGEICCLQEWDEICVDMAFDLCVTGGVTDPTPSYENMQGYLRQETYDEQPGGFPPGYNDLIPFWPDGSYFSGYDGHGYFLEDPLGLDPYAGLRGLARELYEVYGIDRMNMGEDAPLLAKGKTTKVAVIEWAYWPDHEDLDVTLEPGQTMILIPWITHPDHGTSCLSIINAIENGFGVTGVAPEADAYFFPLTSVEEGPRELTAWTSAILTLDPGDVISCSYGPGPGNLNTFEASWTLMRLAADLGISVVVSAGNACYDLDNAEDFGDSGATVVGAGTPGRPHYRLIFSNYFQEPDPTFARSNSIHVQAWGELVTACGKGDLFFPGGDPNRSYTAIFNGTSAAAPQVAGLTACMQGIAKQFYGIPVRPEVIRSAVAIGWPQSWGDPTFGGGIVEGVPCSLDTEPDEGPNRIGSYTLTTGLDSACAYMLSQSGAGFDGSPLVDEIYLVRGEHIFGNVFSVKGSDNSYYVAGAQYTDRNYTPGPSGGGGGPGVPTPQAPPEIALINYLASGDITDIVALGHADIPGVTAMDIELEVAPTGVFTILFCEAFDWDANRWSYIGVSTEIGDPGPGLDGDWYFDDTFVASAPARFVRSSDDRILVRFWTLGFTISGGLGGSGNLEGYRQRIDLINIDLDEQFGEILP